MFMGGAVKPRVNKLNRWLFQLREVLESSVGATFHGRGRHCTRSCKVNGRFFGTERPPTLDLALQ